MNILQRLVHGGRAFLLTVNEVDLALSATGGAEVLEQFVVVGVAGEGVQRFDAGADGVQIAKNPHLQRTVEDAAAIAALI